MSLTEIHKSIYQTMLAGWIQYLLDMVVRPETINDVQSSAMAYETDNDSSIQAVCQGCHGIEGHNLSKFGLKLQLGGIYR